MTRYSRQIMRLHHTHHGAEATAWLEEGECTVMSVVSTESGKGYATVALHRLLEHAVLLGAHKVVVDNVTDDPARAARGLYRLFQWVAEGRGPEMVLWVGAGTLEQIRDVANHPRRGDRAYDDGAPRGDT